jgi:hypothetical protein
LYWCKSAGSWFSSKNWTRGNTIVNLTI